MMSPGELIAAITAAVTACCGAAGAVLKYVMDRIDKQRAEQRAHEISLEDSRVEHDRDIVARLDAVETRSEQAYRELQREVREDRKESTGVSRDIQRQQNETLAALTAKVGELITIINLIRDDVSRAGDRGDPGAPPGPRPGPKSGRYPKGE